MKIVPKIQLTLLLLLLVNPNFSVSVGICRENEQQALERVKKEAHGPEDLLSFWVVGKDCCEWKGIACHNATRRVTELHIDWFQEGDITINNVTWLLSLSNLESLYIDSVDLSKATNWLQVINMLPSLVELRLTNCSLQNIPPLLDHHNFSSLELLDISKNHFNSPVPKWMFNLPSLVYLDLGQSNFIGPLYEGPVNLTSLTTLYASDNSFNSSLPRWLFDIHNLEDLVLSRSGIRGALPINSINVTKLNYLDLSHNNLNSIIPNWLSRCKNLTSLRLADNKLTGNLPKDLGQLSMLNQLDVSYNMLEGEIPKSLGQLSMLQQLDVSYNMLEGVVTEDHFNNLTQLWEFLASGNNLTLKVSQNWIPPFKALDIEVGGWNLGPQFPMWLQTQQEITLVDISNGGLEGGVPTWFWNLSSQMQLLNLSHNRLVGGVEFSKVTKDYVDGRVTWLLGSNNFSGPLTQISPHVVELDISNNYFSGGLSHFLCEAKNESYSLGVLNLGKNYFSQEIPECWMNWPMLEVVILSKNNLVGGIPRSIGLLNQLKSLVIRGNNLVGALPLSLGNCTKLLKLDLAENEFVGQLPAWLGMKLSNLIILSLRSNKFHGELPLQLCHLKNLRILDLANNSFSGIIPRCIDNFKAMITEKSLDDNTLYYVVAYALGFVRESAMVTTKGNMYHYDTILPLVTSMDMSNNNLSGDIPIGLSNLVGLRFCNFSKNQLTGRIPNGIGHMKVLESIDLSKNQLSGHIPPSLSSLSTLSFLNLSYNNLSGMIPLSTQLQSFSPSSFQGNKLCGLPLSVNCSTNVQLPNLVNEKEESDGLDEKEWFYISMAVGFVLNFWVVSALLIFKRHAYYRHLDSSWKSLCAKLQF